MLYHGHMPHLHTGPGQHDLTISAFIIRIDGPKPQVMLHLHKKTHHLLQFGGHVELNETPWQGLLRELVEESGYAAEQLSVLQPPGRFATDYDYLSTHPLPYGFNTHAFIRGEDHFHSDLSYAVVADSEPKFPIGDGESSAISLYTAADLRALSDDLIFSITRDSALYILEHLLSEWEQIPATAWPVS